MEATPRVTFQVISDTHLEFNAEPPAFPVTARFLLLCGDIGVPGKRYYAFLRAQSERYERVFVVYGNHEYYGGSSTDDPSPATVGPPNVVFLDRGAADAGGVTVLGATLWSEVTDAVFARLADKTIRMDGARLTAARVREMHARDVAWLRESIAAAPGPVLVMTHHAPVMAANAGKYAVSPFKSAFATELQHLFAPNVKAWAFGHTHIAFDETIDGVRLVANGYGYSDEIGKIGFDAAKVITIE